MYQKTGKVTQLIPLFSQGPVQCLEWSSNCCLLASCGEGGTKVWTQTSSGWTPVYSLDYKSLPLCIKWSPVISEFIDFDCMVQLFSVYIFKIVEFRGAESFLKGCTHNYDWITVFEFFFSLKSFFIFINRNIPCPQVESLKGNVHICQLWGMRMVQSQCGQCPRVHLRLGIRNIGAGRMLRYIYFFSSILLLQSYFSCYTTCFKTGNVNVVYISFVFYGVHIVVRSRTSL